MNKIFFSALLLFLLLSSNAFSQVDLNRGLVAYYPFNGNAKDATGNGLNGIERNGYHFSFDDVPMHGKIEEVRNPAIYQQEASANCSLPTPVSVPCNNWLYNPSNPSYAQVGEIDIPGNKVTVEAVFNRTTPYSGGMLYAGDLVSKHNTPSDANYLLRPNDAEITTTNGYFRTPGVCEIQLNKTYHVAMVYDGSTLKFYRNGFLLSQVAASGNLFQNNWKTRIGWYEPQGVNTNFIGYINEVRIWNVAKSQQEIQAYMNTSLPNPASQTGLLAYYTFDNLLNKQGNAAYNGVLGGSAAINATNTSCAFVVDSCNIITPVTITSLSATAFNKAIQVKWHTEEESGIRNYAIERSLSANGSFVSMGTVNANNRGNGNSYSYTDNSAKLNTRYFYRLQVIENTGAKKYSIVKDAILKSSGGFYVNIYPNPTAGFMNVYTENAHEAIAVNVYNNLGQLLIQKKPVLNSGSAIQLDLRLFAKGNYWVKITTVKETVVKKLEKL